MFLGCMSGVLAISPCTRAGSTAGTSSAAVPVASRTLAHTSGMQGIGGMVNRALAVEADLQEGVLEVLHALRVVWDALRARQEVDWELHGCVVVVMVVWSGGPGGAHRAGNTLDGQNA
jgi:hypothetical protein